MSETIIARLTPSPARRILASGSTGGLGLLVLWLAAREPAQSIAPLIALLVLAAVSLAFSYRVWRATSETLELTSDELREAGGRQLCSIENVRGVERGLLAWKPAGGFAVILHEPLPRVWEPGLWWRSGRRIMIGGATNGGEAKAMADLMRLELHRRGETRS